MASEFTDLVHAALQATGGSQTRLAELCAVSRQTIHLWLTGEHEPRPRHRKILRKVISESVLVFQSGIALR